MSVRNIKGIAFAILNDKGFYDLYDGKGVFMDIPKSIIRITQTPNDVDKIVFVAPINVVKDKDEMNKILSA